MTQLIEQPWLELGKEHALPTFRFENGERVRLTRELGQGLLYSLSVIAIELKAIAHSPLADSAPFPMANVNSAQEVLRNTIERLLRIVEALRSSPSDEARE